MIEARGSDTDLLSVEVVAQRLEVQPVTVYRWCRSGRLRCVKPGKAWRIQRADLDAFLQQSTRPQTLAGYLERFLMTPDQVLAVAEDVPLLRQFDAAFFQIGAARDAVLIKVYDPQATTRASLQASLREHGLAVDRLEQRNCLRWVPARTLADGVAALEAIVREVGATEAAIWVIFDWPSVGEMEAKLRQQAQLAQLIMQHPHLVVATGVVEPEPEAWPALADQWQLLGTLQGLIRFARGQLLLSRVVTLPV